MMLTVKEVAEELKVTKRTVFRLIKSGKLKAIKLDGAVRISQEAFKQFIENAEVGSQ